MNQKCTMVIRGKKAFILIQSSICAFTARRITQWIDQNNVLKNSLAGGEAIYH